MLMFRSQSVVAQPCSTPVKSMVDGCAVQPPSNINCNTVASPVNATRLVHLANIAIDSHENALDCRVDSASLPQKDVSDRIKLEDGSTQSDDANGGLLVADGQLSRGKTPLNNDHKLLLLLLLLRAFM